MPRRKRARSRRAAARGYGVRRVQDRREVAVQEDRREEGAGEGRDSQAAAPQAGGIARKYTADGASRRPNSRTAAMCASCYTMDPPADSAELGDMRRTKPTANARSCRIADVASSHIYALAWMPSAAAAMSIQSFRATGARRSPTLRILRSRRIDRAVRTECPVLARLAGGRLIVAGAESLRGSGLGRRDRRCHRLMRKIACGLIGSVLPVGGVNRPLQRMCCRPFVAG
jgi:hypothetical protein